MFELLLAVNGYPDGYAINQELKNEIKDLFNEAVKVYEIDVIGISECGVDEMKVFSKL